MGTSVSQRLNILSIILKIRALYSNAVHPVICYILCEGWKFAHMWKTLAWPHHVTKRRGLDSSNWFNSVFFFIEVFAQSQETERSCICVLRVSIFRCILEMFHNVVLYVFQLIRTIWKLIILVYLTLSGKHIIPTLSVKLKCICNRCETDQKNSQKSPYSTCI